jgi:hypothetical protein
MKNVLGYWIFECRFYFKGIREDDEREVSGQENFNDGLMHRTKGEVVRYLQLTLRTSPGNQPPMPL